jgi:hypothetical protein
VKPGRGRKQGACPQVPSPDFRQLPAGHPRAKGARGGKPGSCHQYGNGPSLESSHPKLTRRKSFRWTPSRAHILQKRLQPFSPGTLRYGGKTGADWVVPGEVHQIRARAGSRRSSPGRASIHPRPSVEWTRGECEGRGGLETGEGDRAGVQGAGVVSEARFTSARHELTRSDHEYCVKR